MFGKNMILVLAALAVAVAVAVSMVSAEKNRDPAVVCRHLDGDKNPLFSGQSKMCRLCCRDHGYWFYTMKTQTGACRCKRNLFEGEPDVKSVEEADPSEDKSE